MNYKKTIYKICPLSPLCNPTQRKILSKNTKKEKPDLQESLFLYTEYPHMHPRDYGSAVLALPVSSFKEEHGVN